MEIAPQILLKQEIFVDNQKAYPQRIRGSAYKIQCLTINQPKEERMIWVIQYWDKQLNTWRFIYKTIEFDYIPPFHCEQKEGEKDG